jgi:hypothetical protein
MFFPFTLLFSLLPTMPLDVFEALKNHSSLETIQALFESDGFSIDLQEPETATLHSSLPSSAFERTWLWSSFGVGPMWSLPTMPG